MPQSDQSLTTIYLIRHAESEANAGIAPERGRGTSKLTPRGIEQAHALARKLKDVHADAVLASSMVRARHTAEIVAHDRGIPVEIVPELSERDMGSLEGREGLRETEEFREQYLRFDELDDAGKMDWKLVDDMESEGEAGRRLGEALRRIASEYPGRTVIAVAHGTVMRSFLVMSGYIARSRMPFDALENTGYVILETDGEEFTVVETHGLRVLDENAEERTIPVTVRAR